MTKLSLVLLFQLLSVSAMAQFRTVAPSAGALAWSGPIAAFFGAVGQAGIGQLDSVSLPRLTTFDAEGRLPLVKSPELLNPLAQTLAEAFVEPAEFATMPLEFQVTILRTAASLTEERLGMKVWHVVLDTNKGIARSQFADIARKAREARETSIYLNDRTLEGLNMLEQRVADYARARDEAMRAYLEDLPKRIAAGSFDGKTLLQTEDDGGRVLWKTEGSSPESVFPTPEGALDARIAALESAPAGPWSVREAELLLAARHTGMESGALNPSRWTNSARERLEAIKERGELAGTSGRLAVAAQRFEAGEARASDVKAINRFYSEAVAASRGVDWGMRARVLATIHEGWQGLPSWENLLAGHARVEKRKETYLRMSVLAWMGGAATSLILAVAAQLGLVSPIASALALAVLVASSLYIVFTELRRHNPWGDMDLMEMMRTYFE